MSAVITDMVAYENGVQMGGTFLAVVNGEDTGQILVLWEDGALTVEDCATYDKTELARRSAMLKAAPLLYEALENIISDLGWLQPDGYYENQLHASDVEKAQAALNAAKPKEA